MIGGHLGHRVSALLDGQLGAEETERAWAHVHLCHICRDQVEREGWIKTRLAGLSVDPDDELGASERLKGSLLGMPPGDVLLAMSQSPDRRPRRTAGLVAIGGSAVGAAVMGVLALGTAPADVPERRTPPAQISTPAPHPVKLPRLTP
ncbi:hypothetical protein [Nocardioides sp. R-C-SC26]|uniref:hypothetical protein n=1 Tax=Nocardioides sp. R-C-SC26 TaxID=2870414 RepID=UPI001E4CC337|nr:hypothetical protein [Nocardioides sp. R-C-SC26]